MIFRDSSRTDQNVTSIFKDYKEYRQVWLNNKLYFRKPLVLLRFYLANMVENEEEDIEDNSLIYYNASLSLEGEHIKMASSYFGNDNSASSYEDNDVLFYENSDSEYSSIFPDKRETQNFYVNRPAKLSSVVEDDSVIFMGNNDTFYTPKKLEELKCLIYLANNISSSEAEGFESGSIILYLPYISNITDINGIKVKSDASIIDLTLVEKGEELTTWKNQYGALYYTDKYYPDVGDKVYSNTELDTTYGTVTEILYHSVDKLKLPVQSTASNTSLPMPNNTLRVTSGWYDTGTDMILQTEQIKGTAINADDHVIDTSSISSIGVRDRLFNSYRETIDPIERIKPFILASYIEESSIDELIDNNEIVLYTPYRSIVQPTAIVVDAIEYKLHNMYDNYTSWKCDDKILYTIKHFPEVGEIAYEDTAFDMVREQTLFVQNVLTEDVVYLRTSIYDLTTGDIVNKEFNNNDIVMSQSQYDTATSSIVLDKEEIKATYGAVGVREDIPESDTLLGLEYMEEI